MEKGKLKEDNEIVKALESIHFENQNLQLCLKKIVITRRLLEAKWDSATNHLASFVEASYNLQDANIINLEKIQALEKEVCELEEAKKTLADTFKNLKAEIKQYKEEFDTKIDNFVVASDKLCAYFLLAISNNETTEKECLMKLVKDFDKIKEKILEKENIVAEIKKELEEYDFYDFPEDPMESEVHTETRQFIMNMMENNLMNARQQLEDLNKLAAENKIK